MVGGLSGRGATLVAVCALSSTGIAAASADDPRVDVLAGFVRSEAAVRAAAVQAAGEDRSVVFLGPLVVRATDPAPEVRAAAATALGALGVPRTMEDLDLILSTLGTLSDDRDPTVGQAALQALSRFPFPEVQRVLRRRAKDAKRPPAYRAAARAALGAADPTEARQRLDAYLTLAGVEGARQVGAPVSVEARWQVPADSLIAAARDLLGPQRALRPGAVDRFAASPDHASRFPFLAHALHAKDPKSRRVAARALVQQGGPRVARALEGSLEDPDAVVRLWAVQGVATRRDVVSAQRLSQRFEVETVPEVLDRLARALRAHPEQPVLQALEPWTAAKAPQALRALTLLETRTSTAATRLLVDFVAKTREPVVARRAGVLVGKRADRPVIALAVSALRASARSTANRTWLVGLLEGRAHPSITTALLDLLAKGEGDSAVIGRLRQEPEAAVRARALALLTDPAPKVRQDALQVVKEFRGPDVVAATRAALDVDPNQDLAFAILEDHPPKDILGPRLELLADARHARRHPRLLRALTDTQDPRIPAPVARAAIQQPGLAELALELLLRQPAEPAARALETLADAPQLPPQVRAQAVQALVQAALPRPDGSVTPADPDGVELALRRLAKDEAQPVRYAARNGLHTLAPARYPSWDPYGRIPLIIEGAAFGAGLMVMATDIADAGLSPAFVGGAGAVLGGATPFLLTLGEDVTLGDAGFFGTYGLWGTGAGYGLGLALDLDRKDRLWATVAGEAVGVTAGAVALTVVDWGLDDVAFANFTALETGVLSAGISALVFDADARRTELALGVGLVGGAVSLVPLALLTRRLQISEDIGLIATTMGHGALLGSIAPGVVLEGGLTGQRAAVGAALGQSAGYLAGLVWAQNGDLRAADAGWSYAGAAIGAAAFGGLGLSLDGEDARLRYGLLQAGTAVGALTLGLVGDDLRFRDNDGWVVALAGAAGALAGADLSVRIEEGTLGEPGLPGGMLMGAGLGTAAGLALSQFVDLSDRTLLYSVLGAGVGAAAGIGVGGMFPDLGVQDRSRISSGLTVLGLALALPWAENLEMSPRTGGYGAAAGAVLGGLTSLTPFHFEDDPSAGQVASGALLGAAVGTFAGLGAAQGLELELRQTAQVTMASVAAAGFGGGLGLVIPDQDASLAAGLAQGLGLATFVTTSGLAAHGLWRGKRPRRAGAPGALRYGALGLHGALHGGAIAATWRPNDEDIPSREIAGGVMLGTSAGVLLGLGGRALGAPRLDAGDVLETSLLTTASYAVAGGVGLATQDRRLSFALGQGLGIATYATGWLVSPHTEYDRQTPFTLGLGAGIGAWLGGWGARVARGDPTGREMGGGALAGAGLGTALGVVWNQLEPDRPEVEVLLDTTAGAAIGGGLAFALDPDDRAAAVFVEAGTMVGLGVGLALASSTTFTPPDRGVVALSTTLGAWHGAFAADLFGEGSTRTRVGGAVAGAGVGYALGTVAAQVTDPDGVDVLEVSLLGLTAETLAGGLGLVLRGEQDRVQAAALQAAGITGLAIAGLIAPHTEYSGRDAGLISITGAYGLAAGNLLAHAVDPDGHSQVRLGANLLGASAGVLVGVAASQGLELSPGDQVEAALLSLMGSGIGLGLADTAGGNGRSRALATAIGGGLGLTAGLVASEYTDYSNRDVGLLAYTSGLGAWIGAWLPSLGGEQTAQSRAMAASLGLGTGWVVGSVASQFTEVPPEAIGKGVLTWLMGTGFGAGLGLLLPEIEGRETVALMQGLGTAGALGGAILHEQLELEDGDYALMGAGALFGGALGLTLPAFVDDAPETAEVRVGGVLLGASAGLLLTGVVGPFASPDPDHVLEASLASLFAQGLGLGVGLMIPDSSEALRFGLLDGFAVAGLAASLWLAPQTEYDGDSGLTLALGGMLGGGLGALTPTYWNGEVGGPAAEVGGGALAGTAAGVMVGAVLDQAFDLDARTRNHAALGAVLGGLTGSGLGILSSEDDRWAVGLGQGLAVAGAVALGATLEDMDYTAGDVALGTAYIGYLTWHSMGLTLLLDGTNRQAAGVVASTVGLGALTGMYLAPYINLTLSDTLMLLAGNVWGTWIGGWGGALLEDALDNDLEGRRQVGLTLIATVLGSDVGLALTGMVVGEILDVPPTQFAFINLGGLSGMLIGMLAAGFADGEPLKAGNVIGSLSGLLAGAIITSFFDWSEAKTWDQLLSSNDPPPAPVVKDDLPKPRGDSGFGIEHWMPAAQMSSSPEGDPIYLFTISGVFR